MYYIHLLRSGDHINSKDQDNFEKSCENLSIGSEPTAQWEGTRKDFRFGDLHKNVRNLCKNSRKDFSITEIYVFSMSDF